MLPGILFRVDDDDGDDGDDDDGFDDYRVEG